MSRELRRDLTVRRRQMQSAIRPKLFLLVSVIAVLGLGLITLPPSTTAISARIDGQSTGFATAPAVPATIAFDGSDAQIQVIPIRVSSTGVLEPPSDPSVAGWWASGPRPGADGTAVITGYGEQRSGAFSALDGLHRGDRIRLTAVDGKIRHYRVTNRREIGKTELEPGSLGHTEGSDLLLVTCVGRWEHSVMSYENHLLITAGEVAG